MAVCPECEADVEMDEYDVDKGSQVAPLGHYVLADVYTRQGKRAEAEDEVAKARRIQSARRHAPAEGD